jgi:hypothetical protein
MKNGGNDHRDHCHQGRAYQSYAPYADAATAALLRWFGGRLKRPADGARCVNRGLYRASEAVLNVVAGSQ